MISKKIILTGSFGVGKTSLFNQFIHSIWDSHKLKIYGLSAQGQSLSKDEIDDDYIDEGPENKGYLILPNGEKCKDITRLIADLL